MHGPTTTRWRLFRASVFAVVAVQLAALGHALGGGGLPDPAVLLTVAAFLGGAVSSLATRRLSGAQICALLLTSQLVFHSVFEVTATHAEHASTGSAVGTGQMLLFHLVAALATSWLLTCGESTLFRLSAALRRVLVTARRVAGVPRLPSWTVMISGGTGAVRLNAGELSLISRRGPPHAH